MARQIKFEGKTHNFPDDVTDEEIEQVLSGSEPSPKITPKSVSGSSAFDIALKVASPSLSLAKDKGLDLANQAASGIMESAVGFGNLPMQAVRMGGEALGIPSNYLPLSTAEINQRNRETGFTAPQSQDFGMRAARFAGEVIPSIATFRAPASIPEAIGQSSVISAAQPAENLQEFNRNVGIGTAAGGVLSSIFRPAMRPDVKKLMSEGITPTPGQLYGGVAQRAEEALTSVPLIGDVIRSGQRRSIAQLNKAAIDRALTPIGQKLPSNVKAGREAIDQAENILSSKYDDLLPKLTAKEDDKLISDLVGVLSITRNLSDDTGKQLGKIIENEVLSKFKNNNGQISGEVFKGIESELGSLARGYRSSESYDTRQLSLAIDAVRNSLRSSLQRSNPSKSRELSKINRGWANLTRVKIAGSSDRAGEMFSPAQLQAAVRRADSSKNKGAFATGKALMQDLSDPAYRALGSKVPDSGTPLRTMAAMGAAGGAAYISPYALLGAPLLAGYMPITQQILAKGLTSRAGLRSVPIISGNLVD